MNFKYENFSTRSPWQQFLNYLHIEVLKMHELNYCETWLTFYTSGHGSKLQVGSIEWCASDPTCLLSLWLTVFASSTVQ